MFKVIERPNDWDRQVRRESEGLSALGRWRRDFWEHVRRRHPDTPVLRPGYAGSNVNHKIPEVNIRLSWWLSKGSHAGMFLAPTDGTHWESVCETLNPYRSALAERVGAAQKHDGFAEGVDQVVDPDESHSLRLYLDPYDRANWDKIADWLDSRRRIYAEVLTAPPGDGARAAAASASDG